jgi:PAS domain-containing protein
MSHRGVSAWETEGIDNSQHSLEALVRLAPLAIIEVDLEGKIKNWNPAAERCLAGPKMKYWAETTP